MKNKLILLILILGIGQLSATPYAGEIFGFAPGVRNQAMGSTGLTLANSGASGWWNPALLSQQKSSAVELLRSNYFSGLLAQNQVSLSFKNGNAFYVNHLAVDKIKLTRLEESGEELGNENRPYAYKTISNQDLILSAAFARSLNPKFAIGFAPKLAYRNLAEHSGFGLGADLGVHYSFSERLALGANLRDFFGTQILWESGVHEIALPNLDLELGYNQAFTKHDIPVYLLLRGQFFPEDLGEAASFSSSGISADLHGGLMLKPIPALSILAGYDVDSFTSGVGIELGAWGLDYAFKAAGRDALGNVQKLSLIYKW